MSAKDKLVEHACKLAGILREPCRDSHSLDHPERPARGSYEEDAPRWTLEEMPVGPQAYRERVLSDANARKLDREERDYER